MRPQAIAILLLVLALVSLPYLYAARLAGPDFVFGGFLLNPQDGNSYLAKMMEGWRGDWRFTLPYTAQPGNGAYLFLFYLALGHLARLFGLGLPLTFHLARLAGALFMLIALYRFFGAIFRRPGQQLLAFALAALGSGMGWLLLLSGAITSDFWVAEAYPFLSAYATPHFAFGLGLLLLILTPEKEMLDDGGGGEVLSQSTIDNAHSHLGWRIGSITALLALLLSIVAPFGVVVAAVALGGVVVWAWFAGRRGTEQNPQFRRTLEKLLWVLVGGGPLLLYAVWVARADPVLAGWNSQNLTPSPAWWDLVISFSPLLLLAIPGAWLAWKDDGGRAQLGKRLLLSWAGLGLLLLYLPFDLQRRFMMGLYVPLAGLATLGLTYLATRFNKRMALLVLIVFLLILPTNLLVLLAANHGAQTHDPQIYLTRGEAQAMQWITTNTAPGALVLAAPDTGLFIPAYTGRRVLYGHPYETVNAEAQKAQASAFFAGQDNALLAQNPVTLIFWGPRERQLGNLPPLPGWNAVYSAGNVTLYAAAGQAER